MSIRDDVERIVAQCEAQGYELQIDQVSLEPFAMGNKHTTIKLTSVQKPSLAQIAARAYAVVHDAAHMILMGQRVDSMWLAQPERSAAQYVVFDRSNPEHMQDVRKALDTATGNELDAIGEDVYCMTRIGGESDDSWRRRLIKHADLQSI